MPTTMVDSQFAAFEAPSPDEIDVVSVDASGETASVVERIEAALETFPWAPRRRRSERRRSREAISSDELRLIVDEIAAGDVLAAGARRVLLVPPDLTRFHSRAGEITGLLFERLCASGCEVGVLPALGTHGP